MLFSVKDDLDDNGVIMRW